jgi:flagellin
MEINDSKNTLQQLSSGKRINSAADDPAGSQIVQRFTSEVNANSAYISNSLDSSSFINTASNVLDNINNDVIRIRELTVQAGNGIYNEADKKAIQKEVDLLQSNINDAIENSEFNSKSLFDGIESSISENNTISISPNIEEKLDIDVSDPESLDNIDNFLKLVEEKQTELGAQANVIDRSIQGLFSKNINESSARGKIEDLDYASATSNKSIQEVLDNIKLTIQKAQDKQKGNIVDLLI